MSRRATACSRYAPMLGTLNSAPSHFGHLILRLTPGAQHLRAHIRGCNTCTRRSLSPSGYTLLPVTPDGRYFNILIVYSVFGAPQCADVLTIFSSCMHSLRALQRTPEHHGRIINASVACTLPSGSAIKFHCRTMDKSRKSFGTVTSKVSQVNPDLLDYLCISSMGATGHIDRGIECQDVLANTTNDFPEIAAFIQHIVILCKAPIVREC
jgi:hypothetical protein